MTIALGMVCEDGVVLAADREISSTEPAMTYAEDKIFPMIGPGWAVVSAYAGYPHLMKPTQDRLAGALSALGEPLSAELFRLVLARTLAYLRKTHRSELKYQQMLCAISVGKDFKLYRAQSDLVSEVPLWDCLGVGDSPLPRFLAEMSGIERLRMTCDQAMLITLHIAKEVDGRLLACGKGADVVIVRDGGVEASWEKYRQLMDIEFDYNAVSDLVFDFTATWRTDEQVYERMEAFCQSLLRFRKELRTKVWAKLKKRKLEP